MANPAQSTIAANIHPGKWEKALLPDEQLKSFTRYAKEFHQWLVIVEMDSMRMDRKWNLFITTGRENIEDLVVHQTAIEIRHKEVVVQQQGPPAVAAADAIVPTPWEAGIELCKAAIREFCSKIVTRKVLFTEMQASNYPEWRKWVQELSEQSKRVNWDNYGWQQATLDAVLYQCPDPLWKKKIMQGQLHLQEALEWGIRYVVATDQGKVLAGQGGQIPNEPEAVDRVKQEPKPKDCMSCG